jgi:hypothetical protein
VAGGGPTGLCAGCVGNKVGWAYRLSARTLRGGSGSCRFSAATSISDDEPVVTLLWITLEPSLSISRLQIDSVFAIVVKKNNAHANVERAIIFSP